MSEVNLNSDISQTVDAAIESLGGICGVPIAVIEERLKLARGYQTAREEKYKKNPDCPVVKQMHECLYPRYVLKVKVLEAVIELKKKLDGVSDPLWKKDMIIQFVNRGYTKDFLREISLLDYGGGNTEGSSK